ncbi:hypothetical protein [Clostridium botulinum]|uniref:hypothetical protein n=1 Tax=Clostridium botulinum TaxID=1491 RepID=UPI003DA5233E
MEYIFLKKVLGKVINNFTPLLYIKSLIIIFKLTKSDVFKGELFINNTKYDIKRLSFINYKSLHNKYIGQIKNSKSNYNFSIIFISEDLNMASISNYNKNYDILCTTKNLNDMKNLDMKFFKE